MAKTKAKLPVAPALAKLASNGGDAERFARLEAAASDIYALSQDRIGKGQSDYRNMFQIEGASEEDLRKAEELEELGEFFDDEVESIRYFDIATQTSIRNIEKIYRILFIIFI